MASAAFWLVRDLGHLGVLRVGFGRLGERGREVPGLVRREGLVEERLRLLVHFRSKLRGACLFGFLLGREQLADALAQLLGGAERLFRLFAQVLGRVELAAVERLERLAFEGFGLLPCLGGILLGLRVRREPLGFRHAVDRRLRILLGRRLADQDEADDAADEREEHHTDDHEHRLLLARFAGSLFFLELRLGLRQLLLCGARPGGRRDVGKRALGPAVAELDLATRLDDHLAARGQLLPVDERAVRALQVCDVELTVLRIDR
ncbi:MAG: hypothetical protein ACYS22_13090 [Planctomycetota bacterium]